MANGNRWFGCQLYVRRKRENNFLFIVVLSPYLIPFVHLTIHSGFVSIYVYINIQKRAFALIFIALLALYFVLNIKMEKVYCVQTFSN